MKLKIFLAGAGFVLGILGVSGLALAQSAPAGENIYLSVGDILLQFEGDAGILRDITFNEKDFTVKVPPGNSFRVISKDRRAFMVTGYSGTKSICSALESSLAILPDNQNEIIATIAPLSTQCDISIIDTVNTLRESPAAQKVVKQIILPVSITVEAVSAGALIVTASVGSASFALNLTQLLQQLGILRFYALAFLRFKRKKPWGRVIDRYSGKPLEGVLVQIYENEFKKIKDAQITDSEGRFSAIVTPGRYFLKVSRAGFETKETEVIAINAEEQVLNLEISLLPHIENLTLQNIRRLNFWNAIKKFLDAINPYLLALGTLISLGATLIIPSLINYLGFGVYIILDILKIYFAARYIKPFGQVFDAATKNAVPLAVVRVFDEEKNLLLNTKVTDTSGHFNFLLSPGRYYLTCSKAGFASYRSGAIYLKESGVATLDIELKVV